MSFFYLWADFEMQSYSLPNCLRAICNRGPLHHHDSLSDAKDAQALCEEGARRLQFRTFLDYLKSADGVKLLMNHCIYCCSKARLAETLWWRLGKNDPENETLEKLCFQTAPFKIVNYTIPPSWPSFLYCFLCKTVKEDLICPFTKEALLHMAFIAGSYARL